MTFTEWLEKNQDTMKIGEEVIADEAPCGCTLIARKDPEGWVTSWLETCKDHLNHLQTKCYLNNCELCEMEMRE